MVKAAMVICTLLKNLDTKKGTKRKHKESLGYLQDYLLPNIRLFEGYVKDIEGDPEHPHREQWNSSLSILKASWIKFDNYLRSRNGLLPEGVGHEFAMSVVPWIWDELSCKIDQIKKDVKDALDDIHTLILVEINKKFDLVLPRLDAMVERIASYDECVSTYRKDIQAVLCHVRVNKQDLKSLRDLPRGSMAHLVQQPAESRAETDAVNSQLQATTEKLDHLMTQLADQRGSCTSNNEKRYLDQLSKEVKKQAASIMRLRNATEDTVGITAHVLGAVTRLDVKKEIVERSSGAFDETNAILKKAVPLLEKPHDNLKRQPWQVDWKQMFRIAKKNTPRDAHSTSSDDQFRPDPSTSAAVSSSTTPSDGGISLASTIAGPSDAAPADTIHNTPAPDMSFEHAIIITLSPPPPLPRKSSRRQSRSPPPPPPPNRSPPPIPTSPPLSIPGSSGPSLGSLSLHSPVVPSPSSPARGSAVADIGTGTVTGTDGVKSLFAQLEQRYSASSLTPLVTPCA